MKYLFSLIIIIFSQTILFAKLDFTSNIGQIEYTNKKSAENILFYSVLSDMSIYLTKNSIIYTFIDKNNLSKNNLVNLQRIDMQLIGSNPDPEILKESKSNFYTIVYKNESKGKFAFQYNKITFKNIYNGIHLEFLFDSITNGKNYFKYNFIVEPYADYRQIKWKYQGAEGIQVHKKQLVIKTINGSINEEIPAIYSNNELIDGYFTHENGYFSFKLDETRVNNKLLIIDPTVFSYGSYYGGVPNHLVNMGHGSSYFNKIDIDNSMNKWLIGSTINYGIPPTPGVSYVESQLVSGTDALVTKLNSSNQPLFNILYGSSSSEEGKSIKIDFEGNVWILAHSDQEFSSIQTTSTAFLPQPLGPQIARGNSFIVKFTPMGQRLYASLLPWYMWGMDIDLQNRVWLAGLINLSMITANAHNNYSPTGNIAPGFARFSSSGQLEYGSVISGNSFQLYDTYPYDIKVDKFNNVWVCGETKDPTLQTTSDALQGQLFVTSPNQEFDGFMRKYNPDGTQLLYASFYGGNHNDKFRKIALAPDGHVWFLGSTESSNISVTNNAFQPTKDLYDDGLMACLTNSGTLKYASYFGGADNQEMPLDAVVNQENELWILTWVTGTNSPNNGQSTLPVTPDGLQQSNNYNNPFQTKAYHLSRWSSDGSTIKYGTFLTASNSNYQNYTVYGSASGSGQGGIGVDKYNCVWLAGVVSGNNAPVTTNAFDGLATIVSNPTSPTLPYFGLLQAYVASFCSCTETNVNIDQGDVVNSCNSLPITISASGGSTYQWYEVSNPNQILSNTDSIQIASGSVGSYVVKSGFGECITTDTITVTSGTGNFLTIDTPFFCKGDTNTIVASGGLTYQWTGPFILSGASSSSIEIVVFGPATYTVTSTNQQGCSDTSSVNIQLAENPIQPTITFTNPLLIGNNGYSSYTWFLNNQFFGTGQVINCDGTGTYKLEVTNEFGCKSTRIMFVECGPLSINNNVKDVNLINLPDSWIIQNPERFKSVCLFDVSGRLIYKIINSKTPDIKIDKLYLTEGIYFIQLESLNMEIKSYKLLK